MPKATRKKKEKAKDFQKTKLKVGKTNLAANRTDTSIRSKRVNVPLQNMSEDPNHQHDSLTADDAGLSSKKIGLNDALSYFRHQSHEKRKDAVKTVTEIHQRYKQATETQHVGLIMEHCVRLIIDNDRDVRKAVLSFFQAYLDGVSTDNISPFFSSMMAHAKSAMTHILEEIRLHGVKFLDVFMETHPALVLRHSEKIIPNYLSLLSQPMSKGSMNSSENTSSSSKPSKFGVKKAGMDIFKSLFNFLTLAMKPQDLQSQEFGGGGFGGQEQVQLLDIFNSPSSSLTSEKTAGSPNLSVAGADLKSFIDSAMPLIVDFWIESVPNALDVNIIHNSASLAIMSTCVKMLNLIWKNVLHLVSSSSSSSIQDGNVFFSVGGGGVGVSSTATGFMEWYNSWLDKLTRHFVVRFPFGSSSTLSKDGDVFNILQDMNIIFCEVLSHFMAFKMAAAAALAEATPTGSDSLSKMSKSPAWFKSIHHYILKLYNPSISLESSEDMAIDGSSHLFRRSLQKPNHLRSSFPVIWSLLNTVSDEDRRELFETIIGYHLKSPNPSSQGSGLLFDFLAKICTTQIFQSISARSSSPSSKTLSFSIENDESMSRTYRNWLLALPGILAKHDPKNVESIMKILSLVTECASIDFLQLVSDEESCTSLQTSISYLFTLPPNCNVYGCFLFLPPECQKQIFEIIYHLPCMWSNGLLKSIAICAQSSFAPTQCLDYLVDICIDRQSSQHTALTLDVYMSFIISVFIVGYSKADLSHFDTSAIATTTTTSSSSPSSAPLQAIHAREMKLARDESLVPSEYRPFYKVTVSCLHSHSQLSRRLIDTLVHSFKVLERPRFELYMQLIAPFLLNFLETVKLPSDSVYSICYMMARLVELMNQEDSYGGLQQYYHHQQQLSYEALIQWPLHSVTRGVTEKIDAVHDLTNTDAADMLNILKFFYMHVPAVQETILSTFSEQLRGIISTTTASAATTSEQVVLLLKVLIEIIGDAAAKTKGSDITATSQLDSLVVIEEVCRGVETFLAKQDALIVSNVRPYLMQLSQQLLQ